MVGFMKNKDSHYYICNTHPNRKGLGCGPSVYVPKDEIESTVVLGLRNVLSVCTDPKGMIRDVNDELRSIWEESHGIDPAVELHLSEAETKIANIRKAIEEGLADTAWANQRLRDLTSEREQFAGMLRTTQQPPQIDIESARAHGRLVDQVFAEGSPAEKKRVMRSWVAELKLAPESLAVNILYQIPEPVVVNMGAGACSVSMHQ